MTIAGRRLITCLVDTLITIAASADGSSGLTSPSPSSIGVMSSISDLVVVSAIPESDSRPGTSDSPVLVQASANADDDTSRHSDDVSSQDLLPTDGMEENRIILHDL